MDISNYLLTDNQEKHRFEIAIDHHIALVEYILAANNEIFLTHTEVPKALENQGIGSQLVLRVLQEVEQRGLRLIPLCPFVATYIKRHPEWRKLVMPGYNV